VATQPSQAGPTAERPVRTLTTGNGSELVKTIPISRKRGAKSQVVMRLNAKRLRPLRAGDKLLTSAEVEVTTCLDAPERPGYEDACVGKVYPYDPHVQAKIILAQEAGSKRGKVIGATRELECRQQHPHRNHHCVLVLPWKADRLANDCTGCHVNLVMTAWKHDRAKRGHRLVIGAHEKDNPIEQDKGRLNLVRFRPGDTPTVDPRAGRRMDVRVPIANEGQSPQDVMTRSARLTNLKAGDEIYVKALTRTNIGSVPYNVLITSEVYTARGPRIFHGGGTGHYAAPNPEISELNGFNCTQGPSAHRTPCMRPKVGVVRIVRDVDELFINMSINAKAKTNESNDHTWRRDDRGKVVRSFLRVYHHRQG
jgi:hypothetical protein